MKSLIALILTSFTITAWSGDTTGYLNRSAAREALITNQSKVASSNSGAQTYVDCNGNRLPLNPGIGACPDTNSTLVSVEQPTVAPATTSTFVTRSLNFGL